MRVYVRFFLAILSLFCFYPTSASCQEFQHEKIIVRGGDGNPLTLESKAPYSPKKTCGGCHDYNQITNGYHFQQGRTDASGKIIVSDTFDPKYSWNLSSGMYGKYSAAAMHLIQLAKKKNTSPSEIDQSSFSFVQNCGACHPGGGWGEYDRKNYLYYDEVTKKWGYEDSEESPLLDGDYTPLNSGNADRAPWDQSGVSEADCLFCHLKGYRWKEREAALRGKFFKYGPVVGAGWANVKLSHDESGNSKGDEVMVDYTMKEVADFENLNSQIVRRPSDENCWSCHAVADGKRRGRQWNAETDIHNARGLQCVSCHPGNKEHNFAKGDTIQQTVRSDLNHTMASCEGCHYGGKDKQAPKFRHPFSPRHLKIISCQVCHIPFLSTSADLVYDFSSGRSLCYETFKFLSSDPLDPKKAIAGMAPNAWYPALTRWKGRIVPVKSLVVIYWGDLDPETNAVKPIPLWKIQEMKKPALKDDNSDGVPELNALDEIKAFLKALMANDPFGNPIATHPVLLKGGFLYQLSQKGEVDKIRHQQAEAVEFSLSHNVIAGPDVIGAHGCKECHSKKSSFFLRKILVDPYDEKGNPVYVENWKRLGIEKEKLGRLLMDR